MEFREVLSPRSELLVDGAMQNVNDDIVSDSAYNENSLLEEMDSYLEDLHDRLTVSRMVSDSIIRGMVSAIQEEANDRITLKEVEAVVLDEKQPTLQLHRCSLDVRKELDFVKRLERLRVVAEEQLLRMPKDSMMTEEQWEEGIQREIGGIMVQSFIRSLQDEFETMICEQRSLINTVSKNWRKRVDEIWSMRQDLDGIFRCFFSTEGIEEWNHGKKKDIVTWKLAGHHSPSTLSDKGIANSDIVMEKSEVDKSVAKDSPQLMHMSKEELINYFKTEMHNMKREHDIAIREKTEELFKLKRDILNEKKGSSPLHFRKEKDFELMKKMISELILKLDDILLENKELPSIDDGQDMSHWLNERIDTFVSKNEWLQGLLVDERKETCRTVSHDFSNEGNLMEEIERLQLAHEEVKVEAIIKEENYMSVIRNLVSEIESDADVLQAATKIVEDNFYNVYNGVIADILSSINPIILKLYEEKDSSDTTLQEKENALCVQIDENGKLKHDIESLSTTVKEQEKLALEASYQLAKQQEKSDLVCRELSLHRDEASKKEIFITNLKSEMDLLQGKLDQKLQQILQNEDQIIYLNQKLKFASETLAETERQNVILHSSIQEKHEKLLSAIMKEKELKEQLVNIIVSMTELPNAIGDLEYKLTHKMQANQLRLKVLSHQCSQFKQQANLLKKKVSCYKERFEARCEDLQKAENEVDLLGDEVDTLLDLLEKIYVALDHYSPVLQHYPGVVETLKLIKTQMTGDTFKSRMTPLYG